MTGSVRCGMTEKERNFDMNFDRTEWIGNWENFELYFTDTDPLMCQAWEAAENATREKKKNLITAWLFRNGAKRFWMEGCYTITKENKKQLGGLLISAAGENNVSIEWLDTNRECLGIYEYGLDTVVENGLERKTNYLLYAPDAPADCPFRYVLSMPPMPEREAKNHGGLISHFHFQFASSKAQILKENGKLKKPHWYATMCDREATMQQRCNIVRALHQLPELQ